MVLLPKKFQGKIFQQQYLLQPKFNPKISNDKKKQFLPTKLDSEEKGFRERWLALARKGVKIEFVAIDEYNFEYDDIKKPKI